MNIGGIEFNVNEDDVNEYMNQHTAVWLGVDESGSAWLYSVQPNIGNGIWTPTHDCEVFTLPLTQPVTKDWETTSLTRLK